MWCNLSQHEHSMYPFNIKICLRACYVLYGSILSHFLSILKWNWYISNFIFGEVQIHTFIYFISELIWTLGHLECWAISIHLAQFRFNQKCHPWMCNKTKGAHLHWWSEMEASNQSWLKALLSNESVGGRSSPITGLLNDDCLCKF